VQHAVPQLADLRLLFLPATCLNLHPHLPLKMLESGAVQAKFRGAPGLVPSTSRPYPSNSGWPIATSHTYKTPRSTAEEAPKPATAGKNAPWGGTKESSKAKPQNQAFEPSNPAQTAESRVQHMLETSPRASQPESALSNAVA